jgi:hypothetical protein
MGVGHAERPEDVLVDISVERGSRHGLDDEPEHVIFGIRVVVSGPGLEQELCGGKGTDTTLQGPTILVIVDHGYGRETARMVQQLADRDPC